MFFLDHAWLVPLIPAVSFVLILLFGKRFPRGGSEIGITAVGASFLLSCGALVQWINHPARRSRAVPRSVRSAAASVTSAKKRASADPAR